MDVLTTGKPQRFHLVEYAIEGAALGLFMVSATVWAVVLFHPASPVARAIDHALAQRALMGLAMGATAVALIYSPWGKRSGAHMNPAVTLTFYRLGKVRGIDAASYVAAQFLGGTLGMALAAAVCSAWVDDPSVHYVTTQPGAAGAAAAFAAEIAMTFVMMLAVLVVSNHPGWMPYTGLCAGALVWLYITIEAPISGMSLNPARTLAAAIVAGDFGALWVYFAAPPLGMLTAAWTHASARGRQVRCAKLQHAAHGPCFFCDGSPAGRS